MTRTRLLAEVDDRRNPRTKATVSQYSASGPPLEDVTLPKGYRTNPNGMWGFDFSERTIVAHLVDQLDATAREAAGSPETVEALLAVLERAPPHPEHPPAPVCAAATAAWGLRGSITLPMPLTSDD